MRVRRVLAVACVGLAAMGATAGTVGLFELDRDLSVGKVRVSTDLGHSGSLDLYVPLLDWGVRFPGMVRLPARLALDLRTVDRDAAERVASGDLPELRHVRDEAADAIGDYVRITLGIALAAALAAAGLMALALRARAVPLRLLLPVGALAAIASCGAVAVLLPPRGDVDGLEYFANGPDIPVALRAVERATRSTEAISEEINDQLVGLARLVSDPAGRAALGAASRLTLASDLHNNLLALPTLERAVGEGPLFFAGDLTSSGSPFEVALTRRIARIGSRFVFVSGNHDSDTLGRRLAAAGAIVLTERGRLLPGGRRGAVVVRVAGLRVAGYSDPFERRAAVGYRDRYRDAAPRAARQRAFTAWLRPLLGRVDVVMVHSPGLAEPALRELRAEPPDEPLAVLTGHTHEAALRTSENLVELNGGTVGGGGTGDLDENQPFGLAVLSFAAEDGFRPLFADVVEIDARSGAALARRERLDLAGP